MEQKYLSHAQIKLHAKNHFSERINELEKQKGTREELIRFLLMELIQIKDVTNIIINYIFMVPNHLEKMMKQIKIMLFQGTREFSNFEMINNSLIVYDTFSKYFKQNQSLYESAFPNIVSLLKNFSVIESIKLKEIIERRKVNDIIYTCEIWLLYFNE